MINDALLLELLGCGVLRAVDLGRLALTSKALYCFTNLEELWKGMVIEVRLITICRMTYTTVHV